MRNKMESKMKNTIEISREDFMEKFVNPLVSDMTKNLDPGMAEKCNVDVKVIGKTGKCIDFKSVKIGIEIPN